MTQGRGSLYLGRELNADTLEPGDRLEIQSDSLTTHGVIVGMTGSGKTGLGIVLIEEVLASGVPALILDPKGDMGNLLLNFPTFDATDFEPWIDGGRARREGVSMQALAAAEAEEWRTGLEGAGIDGERMRRVRDGVDLRIVTPGSTAGVPLDLVGDLSPPEVSWSSHGESIRDEIEGLVSGLLVLVDIEADPLTSREHILLSNLIEHAWRSGRALDLATLLLQIQEPPMRRLGVFELEAFYPRDDRMKLAMRLNGLMASPSFAEWMMGEPLDIAAMLRAPDGRPRATVVYLSHLSEAERTFVVTLVLSKLVTWMRTQPGTSELGALLYVDEVMGMAPPTAEPASKRPILTLYKQARAHGLGVVMATQNPVDLDYKLMSNAGTWMVGRLQTERDKARILEGLRSASGTVDVGAWDARIGQLGKRQFLLKTAKSAEPRLFSTRWAMSYLRGPLTRSELMLLRPADTEDAAASTAETGEGDASRPSQTPALEADTTPMPPEVAEGVTVRYLDPAVPWAPAVGVAPAGNRLEAGIAARVRLLFDERVGDVRHEEVWEAVLFPLDDHVDAGEAMAVDYDERDFRRDPPRDARYVLGGAPLADRSFFKEAERGIEERLYREKSLALFRNRKLKLCSRPGESEEEFRERCLEAAEDGADAEAEKLRGRYESRVETARRRLADAERRVRELDTDVDQRRQQEVIAGAGQVLSMFLGGRRRVRGLSGMASRRSQTRRTEERLRSATEKAEDMEDAIEELELDLTDELESVWARWRDTAGEIEAFDVPLERTDISLDELVLFWAPRA